MSNETNARIRWKPQPKQLRFLQSLGLGHVFAKKGTPAPPVARLVGYGGSAGGGKTDSLLMAGILACMAYPGCQVAYFRRTYPELEGPGGAIQRSQALLADLANQKLVRYQASHRRWLFFNGSLFAFCHAQEEDSVYIYNSQQFDVLLIDEATHFSLFQIQYLFTRNRLTVKMPAPIFALATNPGGIGHSWYKSLFIDSGEPETVNFNLLGEGRAVTVFFIPARLGDNPALENRDPEYRKTLEALPEHLRKQLLEGDWTSFSGQAFPEFRSSIHIVRPFPIPRWWKRWRANDPGYSDPFAFYWFAADGDGNVYVYREFTRATADPKLTYSEQATRVASLSLLGTEVPGADAVTEFDEKGQTHIQVHEDIDYTVTGMDAFTKHPESGKSITTYYQEAGLSDCIEPVHGPGARSQMQATLHEYLLPFTGPEGQPVAKLRIFSTCKKLIETLPLLIVEENSPERVADINDHWYQALGYGLQSWHASRSKEPPKPPTELDLIWAQKQKLAQQIKWQQAW